MSAFERALQGYSEPTAEEVSVDLRDVHEERRARARDAERERRESEAAAAAAAAEERQRQRQQAEDAAQLRQMAEEAADAEDEAMAERLREYARLEQEQRDGDDRAGEHGGGSSAPVESVQESAEPTPQQDDPDDGEHTSSEAPEEPEPPAEEDEEEHDEPVVEEEEAPEPDPELEEEPLDEPSEPEAPAPEPRAKQPKQASRRPGTQVEVSAFDFVGAEEKGRSVTFKKFPVALVDGLRSSLAAHLGAEEAGALGAQAIVTAFVSAKTGLDVGLDASSKRAAEAFAANDPGMLGVMEETQGLRSDFDELVTRLGPMITRVREMSVAMEAIELSNAFLIADKYDLITPPSARSHEIDMQDPRVQAARDRIASEAADQRRLRQEREHRSNR